MECCREVAHAGHLLAPDGQRLHEADVRIFRLKSDYLLYNQATVSKREQPMKAFFAACIAAIVLAVIGLVVLNHVQEPVDEAFATSYARVG
jgi:hypothetical protein